MRGATVKEQIQWVLSYMQGGSADVYERGDKEIAELRELKQGSKTIEEFVQEFRRAARESRYEERPLVEEFKRGMNRIIQ